MDAQPSETTQNASTSVPATDDLEAVYASLRSYPFDTDTEYLSGLASILGHPATPPTAEELTSNHDLILQVRCFYFARKNNLPPIDPAAYSLWLAQRPQNRTTAPTGEVEGEASTTTEPPVSAAPHAATIAIQTSNSTATEQQPPYPTSFAEIVDLITRNVPVPGIESIPDTVLEHGSSKVDHTPRRKKPWESGNATTTAPTTTDLDILSTSAGTAIPPPPSSTLTALETNEEPPAAGEPSTNLQGLASAHSQAQEGKQADLNGHLTASEGVVKILQPNAIPDSGLLAKD